MSELIARMRPYGTTIFTQMSALAVQTGALNLGQGFPDEDGPSAVLDAAVAAIRAGDNQYPPLPGTVDLRHAIARHESLRGKPRLHRADPCGHLRTVDSLALEHDDRLR